MDYNTTPKYLLILISMFYTSLLSVIPPDLPFFQKKKKENLIKYCMNNSSLI